MSICYDCERYDSCVLQWKCSDTMQGCSAYKHEQTNEEWFCQLSTEEKVGALITLYEKIKKKMRTEIGGENNFWKGNYYREWLKQPHTKE